MEQSSVEDLDPAGTLAAVEDSLLVRRAAEARDLVLAAHWADLHAADPNAGHGTRRKWCGEDRLVQVGGEGTPLVQELCLAELAIARRIHPLAARRLLADALDLRHRLPACWAAVQAGEVEAWLVRRIATLTRPLEASVAWCVDAAIAEDLAGLTPGRLLEVVQARIIEADPVRHEAKLLEEKRRRYVTMSRTDEAGMRHLIARVRAGDAVAVDALVDRVADILRPRHGEDVTKDQLRAEAFGWLARPAELLTLLLEAQTETTVAEEDLAETIRQVDPKKLRSQVVLYVHLHEAAVRTDRGLARIEDIGPLLSREIPDWLGHTHVTVTPVVDLADQVPSDAYEHPAPAAERIHLRCPADAFPHGNQVSRRLDLDHVEAYQPDGPAGQTGDHNSQPLARTGHRAKTHLGYRVRQLRPGSYVWQTPHHLYRLVDHHGTTTLDETLGAGLFAHDPLDRALAEMTLDLKLTGRARTPASLRR